MERKTDFEPLFQPSEHERRAEELIAAINELECEYPDYDLRVENATEAALNGYPWLIYFTRVSGDEAGAQRKESELHDLDVLTASQTSIRIMLRANSLEAYNAVRAIIYELAEKFGAEEESPEALFGRPEATEKSELKKFDPLGKCIHVDLFFVCKKR